MSARAERVSMPSVQLVTSRYQNRKEITGAGLVTVRTTLGAPRWSLGYQLQATIRELAPTRDIFRMPPEQFEIEYPARVLEHHGVEKLRGIFSDVSARHQGRGLVLLCFEDVTTEDLCCHRRLFARWWEEKTGEIVPELGRDLSVLDMNPDATDGRTTPSL